ncbi:MAG: ABC transporter ATP-binding protein [Bdellovibrionales bacterium]|nr:ABC transporter ATP-binding protein [Bdellovibrionales bacterium]
MKVLEVQNVVKNYGSLRAVNQVSFDIKEGEIFGLLGPNGAGKTTLISTIVTLEKADKGRIFVCGHDVEKEPRVSKSLTGFMPQELIIHGYFTVREVVCFYSGYCGVRPDPKHIDDLLKRLSLWDQRNHKVRTLSGGMKRRLLMVKALVHSPKLLLLDEPTAGVDIDLRNTIWDFVRELKSQGASILFTTHYLEEAEQLCDRVAIIHHGEIRQIGPTKDLISQFTARRIYLKLKSVKNFESKRYLGRHEGCEVFSLPYSMNFNDLINEISLNRDDILDIRVREGSLEDIFKEISKEQKK